MYGLAEQQAIHQHHETLRREAARGRPTRLAREDREVRPYVVRELSWELARYLEGANDDR